MECNPFEPRSAEDTPLCNGDSEGELSRKEKEGLSAVKMLLP